MIVLKFKTMSKLAREPCLIIRIRRPKAAMNSFIHPTWRNYFSLAYRKTGKIALHPNWKPGWKISTLIALRQTPKNLNEFLSTFTQYIILQLYYLHYGNIITTVKNPRLWHHWTGRNLSSLLSNQTVYMYSTPFSRQNHPNHITSNPAVTTSHYMLEQPPQTSATL